MILKNVIHDSKRHDQYLFKCNPPAYDRNSTNTIKNIIPSGIAFKNIAPKKQIT